MKSLLLCLLILTFTVSTAYSDEGVKKQEKKHHLKKGSTGDPLLLNEELDLDDPRNVPPDTTPEQFKEWKKAMQDHIQYGDQRAEEVEHSLPDCPPIPTVEQQQQAMAKMPRDEMVARARKRFEQHGFECMDKETKESRRAVREERRLKRLELKDRRDRGRTIQDTEADQFQRDAEEYSPKKARELQKERLDKQKEEKEDRPGK